MRKPVSPWRIRFSNSTWIGSEDSLPISGWAAAAEAVELRQLSRRRARNAARLTTYGGLAASLIPVQKLLNNLFDGRHLVRVGIEAKHLRFE